MEAKEAFRRAHSLFRRGLHPDYRLPDRIEPRLTRSGRGDEVRTNPLIEEASRILIAAKIPRATAALGARRADTERNLISRHRYMLRFPRTASAIALTYAQQDKRHRVPLLPHQPTPKLP